MVFISGCGQSLYYGFLPGTDYKYYKPTTSIDLKGQSYCLEFNDARDDIQEIKCSGQVLDRNTELEGELGYTYFRNYVTSMIEQCNGKVTPDGNNHITINLEGLSFVLIGWNYIVPHGLIQFEVSSEKFNKVYCTDMTDHDNDAPLKWYSITTVKSAYRMIVSGAARRTIEELLSDLEKAG